MGFMDKAKKMAEQAQQKVEEKQKQFNESQSQKAQTGESGGSPTSFDQQGRPVTPAPMPTPAADPAAPAGAFTPPPTDPTAPIAGGDPVGGPAVGDTAVAQSPEPVQTTEPTEDPALRDGVNKSPDPFKPIQ